MFECALITPYTDTTIREIHRVDSSIIAPISVNRRREELRTLVEKEGTLLVQLGSWDNHLTTKDSVRRAVETSKLSMKNQKQFVSLLDPSTCLSVQGRLVRTFVKARDGSRAAPISDATVIRSFVPYLALAIHHDLYVCVCVLLDSILLRFYDSTKHYRYGTMKTNGGNDKDDELSNLTESSVLLLVEALVRFQFCLFLSLSETHTLSHFKHIYNRYTPNCQKDTA